MSLSIEEKKSIIAYRVQKADSVFIEASDNATTVSYTHLVREFVEKIL